MSKEKNNETAKEQLSDEKLKNVTGGNDDADIMQVNQTGLGDTVTTNFSSAGTNSIRIPKGKLGGSRFH